MDFISSLLMYIHLVIMVVVDHFYKSSHFGTLPPKFFSCQAAGLFNKMIGKYHGYPRSINSDRDPIFLSKFLENTIPITRCQIMDEYNVSSIDRWSNRSS